MFLIWISSSVTFYCGVTNKYSNPETEFINYDFAVIYVPTMLLGTKIGTILNKMFSSFILIILIIGLIFISFKKTYTK